MVTLKRATPEAVKYACLHFHYAKRVPCSEYSYNVYNANGDWCGCIIFSTGATPNIAHALGCANGEVRELVRVALNGKQETTSECVSAAMRQLHKDAPFVKMLVSYADPEQGHYGTIYQATNWIYLGTTEDVSHTSKESYFIIHGKKMHPKSVHSMGWKQQVEWLRANVDPYAEGVKTEPKRKYIFVFDKKARREWMNKAKPYPKKATTE